MSKKFPAWTKYWLRSYMLLLASGQGKNSDNGISPEEEDVDKKRYILPVF